MKRIMYGSVALFFLTATLAVGIHIGHQTATAQIGASVIGYNSESRYEHIILLDSGDIYWRTANEGSEGYYWNRPLTYIGNLWDGGIPIPVETKTLGGVKGDFK